MKNRRDFLKFLGIGAGAAASVALAAVAGRGGTPVTPPRAITDIEAPKPYVGPDGMPNGDFIKRAPDIIRDYIPIPELDPPARERMVDNVFQTSPLYDYLTHTGTNVIENDYYMTISGNDLDGIQQSADMCVWNTTWSEMSVKDSWGRNE